ncbi:type II secretion system protein [Desulfurobacterium sp.]
MRRGFTLLEVLVGVTIFAVAASALLFISSKNVERLGNVEDTIRGIYVVKSRIYGLPCNDTDGFKIVESRANLEYGLVGKSFNVNKDGRHLFTFYYYEKE